MYRSRSLSFAIPGRACVSTLPVLAQFIKRNVDQDSEQVQVVVRGYALEQGRQDESMTNNSISNGVLPDNF